MRRRCDRVDRGWSGRFDESLSAKERQALETHVAACADCARAIEAERRVIEHLSASRPVARDDDFFNFLATRVVAIARSEEPRRRRSLWPVIAASLASVVVVAVASWAILRAPDVVAPRQGDGPAVAEGQLALAPDEVDEAELVAAPTSEPSYELSMTALSREEIKLLDDELVLDLPPLMIDELRAAGVADGEHASSAGPDDGLDEMSEGELKDVLEQLGRETGGTSRERRGG